jgi:hypothetical protein
MTESNYSLDDVAVTVGPLLLTEFIKGDAISIEFDEDKVEIEEGTNGAISYGFKRSSKATATLRIFGGSAINDALQLLFDAQQLAVSLGGSPPRLPFFCKDMRGTSQYSAPHCVFMKAPPGGFGEGVGQVEWTLGMGRATFRTGGSNPQ